MDIESYKKSFPIEKFPEKYNILSFVNPEISQIVGNIYKLVYQIVPISLAKEDGDVYAQGWNAKERKPYYSLSGRILRMFLNISGGMPEIHIVEDPPGVVTAKGKMTFLSALGNPISFVEEYMFDVKSFEDELRNSETIKNNKLEENMRLTPEKLENRILSETLKVKKFRVQRAKTGCDSRLCRAIFSLKNFYSDVNLQKPFAVPKLVLDVNNPVVLRAIQKKILGISDELYPTEPVEFIEKSEEIEKRKEKSEEIEKS